MDDDVEYYEDFVAPPKHPAKRMSADMQTAIALAKALQRQTHSTSVEVDVAKLDQVLTAKSEQAVQRIDALKDLIAQKDVVVNIPEPKRPIYFDIERDENDLMKRVIPIYE